MLTRTYFLKLNTKQMIDLYENRNKEFKELMNDCEETIKKPNFCENFNPKKLPKEDLKDLKQIDQTILKKSLKVLEKIKETFSKVKE